METTTIDPNRAFNPGDKVTLIAWHDTPGRDFRFPLGGPHEKTIKSIFVEESGHLHFNIGYTLPPGTPPLKSLDTGKELGESNIYWMHPSRFK